MKYETVSPIVKNDCLQPSVCASQFIVPVPDVFLLVACFGLFMYKIVYVGCHALRHPGICL